MKNHKSNTCLVPHCKSPSCTRGLCQPHYSRLCYLIQTKRMPSLRTMEKRNKVLPDGRGSRKAKDTFVKWLRTK